ncbi:UNVERIFIED_CONTAM: hypothetical protein GTU68_045124, partial [Idotea baltica]|nr:hypothetical protein [Idotea baltica]
MCSFNCILISFIYNNCRQAFKTHSVKSPNFGVENKGWFNWWSDVITETISSSVEVEIEEVVLGNISNHLIKFYSTSEGYEVIPEFYPLVNLLSRFDITLGAISNTDVRVRQVLLQLGIAHYFKFILTSYDARVLKPHPEIFRRALSESSTPVSPSEALHIGDTLE